MLSNRVKSASRGSKRKKNVRLLLEVVFLIWHGYTRDEVRFRKWFGTS
jgi:hypothetical protein